jgi:hypothetical protein
MIPIPRTILSISIKTPPSNQSVGGNIGWNRLGIEFGCEKYKKKYKQKVIGLFHGYSDLAFKGHGIVF